MFRLSVVEDVYRIIFIIIFIFSSHLSTAGQMFPLTSAIALCLRLRGPLSIQTTWNYEHIKITSLFTFIESFLSPLIKKVLN